MRDTNGKAISRGAVVEPVLKVRENCSCSGSYRRVVDDLNRDGNVFVVPVSR